MLFVKSKRFISSTKLNLSIHKVKRAKYVKTFVIFIPEKFEVAFIKSNKTTWILSYNETYKFLLPFTSKYARLSFCLTSNIVKLETLLANSYYTTYISSLVKLMSSFYKPTFKKMKFRGKGYYIYKNSRNTIAPQFGYSHRLYIYSYFNKVKFIGKTIVILFGLVKSDLIQAGLELKSKRSINIFTGRGVRFSRQVVYKKQGKVSSYR